MRTFIKAKYGYVFRNCVVDGNRLAANGKQKLGRPWHNAPIAVYIHTTMRIPLAPEGWTDMGTVPGLFAEYDSRDAQGNLLDLSRRKSEYRTRGENAHTGTSRTSITKGEADKLTYENIIPGTDRWNPRSMMAELPAPANVAWQAGKLTWAPVEGAIGYVVEIGGQAYLTDGTSFNTPTFGLMKVRAVNPSGALGAAGK